MSNSVTLLSLGAGVQSSALALMAARGEITPMPDAAIFADTHGEPAAVYDYLDWLEGELPFPVHRVSGGNLAKDFLASLRGETSRCGQPPFYVRGEDSNDAGGMLWRKCTKEYKLTPIRKATREIMSAAGAKRVEQWIGISLDEIQRCKDSGVKYIDNRFPLIENRLTRHDCSRWMKERGYPDPTRSACVFCPYVSNDRWKKIKQDQPEAFEQACQFDEELRTAQAGNKLNGAGITGSLFVHRSFTPLRDAVLTDEDTGQAVMDFNAECDGMCGV